MNQCKPLQLGRLTALTVLRLDKNKLTSVPAELGGKGFHSSTSQLNLSRF
jgi:Leucine-rich repeat (LRR) protein